MLEDSVSGILFSERAAVIVAVVVGMRVAVN